MFTNNFKISKSAQEVKSRYVVPFCYILAVIAFANVYLYNIKFDAQILGSICAIAGFCAIGIIILKSKDFNLSHLLYSNLLITIFFTTILSLALFTGGIFSFPIWWFGTVPLLATFLLNSFYGLLWYLFVLFSFVVILILGNNGLLPINILANVPPLSRMTISFTLNASLIAFICFLADLIREKAFKESEELKLQSIHLNQMASMGRLASGIAHEVANPLTIAKGSMLKIDRLINEPTNIDKVLLREHLLKIQKNMMRIESVISMMQIVSDQNNSQNPTATVININEILLNAVKIVNEQARLNSIYIEVEQKDNAIEVEGVYSELLKSFSNLMENSINAVSEIVGKRYIKILVRNEIKYVVITIEDNGKGIVFEDREQVFDPFHIGKNAYPGRSFSLSFSKNIINSCRGEVELLDNGEGKTKFKVSLPIKNLKNVTSSKRDI